MRPSVPIVLASFALLAASIAAGVAAVAVPAFVVARKLSQPRGVR